MVHKGMKSFPAGSRRNDGRRGKTRTMIRALAAALTLGLMGCQPPLAVVNRAVTNIDFAWKLANDEILEKDGSRKFKASHYQAFVAAQGTLRKIGTVVEKQDLPSGFLFATAAAPTPLSPAEWEIVKETDTTDMRKIAVEEVGYMGWFANLDPASKDVLINVYVVARHDQAEVSIGMRLRNKKDIKGLKKRTQPPPTAMKLGLEKFWRVFDEQLQSVVGAKPPAVANLQPKKVRAPVAQKAPPRTETTPLPSAIPSHLTKEMCITFAGANRSIDDVKKSLVTEVKRLALLEFFGEVISSKSTVQDYVLSQSVISGKSFGIVRTKGSPRFYNGNSLGEVCVEGEFFITQADLARLAPRTVSEENVCYANEKLTLRELHEKFRAEAITKALTKINPKLKSRDKSELAGLVRNVKLANERVDIATSALCADISFEIVPLEVESL